MMIRWMFLIITLYGYRPIVASDLLEEVEQLEEEEIKLCKELKSSTKAYAEAQEKLRYNEEERYQEVLDILTRGNAIVKRAIEQLKKDQRDDWQRFLDWQDENFGKGRKGYNEEFDRLWPIFKAKWHEKEAEIKRISGSIYTKIDDSRMARQWNSLIVHRRSEERN